MSPSLRLKNGAEPPFAQKVLEEEIQITGPGGIYNLLATLDKGATAMGGKAMFRVTENEKLPNLPKEVVVCGNDSVVTIMAERSWNRETQF